MPKIYKIGDPEIFGKDAVFVGRPSKWGNRFRIGRDGTRDEVIAKYEEWFRSQTVLIESLKELRGKDLVCFCAPQRCHAEVLLKFANSRITDGTL